MTIETIAQQHVVTVEIDTPARAVAEVMRREGVGSVVVTSASGTPVGIVTDRDVTVFGLTGTTPIEKLTAHDLMAEDLLTVRPDASIRSVIRQMRSAAVRRVPVVDQGTLVGIVSLDDIVVHLADELDDLRTIIEAESPIEPPRP